MDFAFRRAVAQARRDGQLYFASLLSEERITEAFGKARWFWRGWVYSPSVTVWVFLSQCLSADHSCREAIAGLIAWRVANGQPACSAETGAYCTARAKIPESACRQLTRETGRDVDDAAPPHWHWHGHRVLAVDGSTVTMADTPENQAEYPQQRGQVPGCGFPIARIVVVFSLAVGTVLDAAIARYQGKQTGENSLFRTLGNSLRTGDLILADRYFGGWMDLACWHVRGIASVVHKHQRRPTDFRTGCRLGKDDHLVSWPKPSQPDWMSVEDYTRLPDELVLRELRVRVPQKGFRTKVLMVITTLVDPDTYSMNDIAQLYRRRWQAELNLRSLKAVMQMDHLRCKTPHRVRNEFFIHLTAYNLIRKLIAVTAVEADTLPWNISFKGALQTLHRLLPLLTTLISTSRWCDTLIAAIGTHVVGNRPDRNEPRVKKRRPKQYKLMQEPRQVYPKRMAA